MEQKNRSVGMSRISKVVNGNKKKKNEVVLAAGGRGGGKYAMVLRSNFFDSISSYSQEDYDLRYMQMYGRSERDVQSQRSKIQCPVCGKYQCGWWENKIMSNMAGEVLKDMLQENYKGDQYYDGADQEQYYQQRRGQSYSRPSWPEPEIQRTEDLGQDRYEWLKQQQEAQRLLENSKPFNAW